MSQYYYYNCEGVFRVFYFDSDYDFKLFKETIQRIDDDNKCGTYKASTLHKLIQSWSVPSGILSSIAVIYYYGTNDYKMHIEELKTKLVNKKKTQK